MERTTMQAEDHERTVGFIQYINLIATPYLQDRLLAQLTQQPPMKSPHHHHFTPASSLRLSVKRRSSAMKEMGVKRGHRQK